MAAQFATSTIYRVDKFKVPAGARDEFLATVGRVHAILRAQSGLVDEIVLEQVSGPGEFNVVTIAVWESAERLAAARASIADTYREIGFDPAALMARLGITDDIGNYVPADVAAPVGG